MSNHPSALQEHVADIRDHNDVRGAVWKERLLEVSIFLFLIIPSMILSLHFIQDFIGIVLAHYYVRAIAN
ncbi:MAG: hypothetical protein A2Y77_12035 [Planctomycetes bacterium RBG_13_62_9]|nr:MAG: hypothetical protein A2Y77_12035 [Planctomycetes bacterium RBG_13_62_9]